MSASESNFLANFFVKSITNVIHFTENIVPLKYLIMKLSNDSL